MASIVRAAGKNVVCKLAAALASTARNRKMASTPSTGPASAAKTLSAVSGLPRPMPCLPMPANIWAEIATSMYVLRIVRMVKSAARPGVLDPFGRRHAAVGDRRGGRHEDQGSKDVDDRVAAQRLDGRVAQDVTEQQVEE